MGRKKTAPAARFAARCALSLAFLLLLSTVSVLLPENSPGPARGTGPGPGLEAGLPPLLVSMLDFVIDITAEAGWAVVPGAIVFLLVRRLNRLALFVTVTALGTVATGLVFTALPVLSGGSIEPATTPAAGHPSASSLFTLVAGGAFLLVFLPAIPARRRGWFIAATAALVALFGAVEVLFRETGPVAVAGGWAAGLLWLAAVAAAFRRWEQDLGRPRAPLSAGLAPSCRQELLPAPARDRVLPSGARGASLLPATALFLWGFLVAAGLLVTRSLAPLQRLDSGIMEWFADHRTGSLTALASVVDHIGNTPGILAVLLLAIPVILAATRRRAPAMVLLAATAGETTIFLAAQSVVGRARPAVEHLAGEPGTSSFPSGHVAASVVTYGCLALILAAWIRYRLRWALLLAAAVLVAAVVLARLYLGMHYPTDIAASLLFAPAWLAVCWRVFDPVRGSPAVTGAATAAPRARSRPENG
jgi:undecaprenyl-diphosphatase